MIFNIVCVNTAQFIHACFETNHFLASNASRTVVLVGEVGFVSIAVSVSVSASVVSGPLYPG